MPERNIRVLPTPQALAQEAAGRIVEAARRQIEQNKSFTLGLSGGSTPKALYELLASTDHRQRIDWPHVEIYFTDERCVPPDDAQSNYRMAAEALLSKVPIPAEKVHRMRGEIDPQQAAIEYGRMLKDRFGDMGLDMALLGMGDDGHTASLFPGTEALKETEHRVMANFVPRMNSWRLTMTAPFLNRSWEVLALITGSGKAQRVAQVLESEPGSTEFPIQLIDPPLGQVTFLLDAAAAGMD